MIHILRSSQEERGVEGFRWRRGFQVSQAQEGAPETGAQSEAPWPAPRSSALELWVLPAGMGVDRLQGLCPRQA